MGVFEFLEAIKYLPEEKKCEFLIIMLTSFPQARDKEPALKF
jgi:hypothetical protein